MAKLTCECGHGEEDKDHYLVEARMWVHAMKEHKDMLEGMSAEQIAGWLKKADKTMGVTA